MPYQKHCFIIVRFLKSQKFFYLDLQEYIFGLRIDPRTRLLGLNDKSKAALRNRSSKMKLLIIDQLFMESKDLWTDIDSRLREIVIM